MGSSRSKPQTIIPPHVPPLRPDIPATFESMNDDTLSTTLEFVGDKSYKSFGGTNKRCREVYISSGMTKKTFLYGYAPLRAIIDKCENALSSYHFTSFESVGKGVAFYNRRDVLAWALGEQKELVLNNICEIAAGEGIIDILEQVWNHNVNENEDYKRTFFGYVDVYAAFGGRLDVVKWVETKGLSINKMRCANEAASGGHLHILQWLQEEQGLQLFGGLYNDAIRGGQLHLMKWLREQEVDWGKWTFSYAAEAGNLEVLQWLHDEDCPWPADSYLRVHERRSKPEVLEWLRVNGYGDRIVSLR